MAKRVLHSPAAIIRMGTTGSEKKVVGLCTNITLSETFSNVPLKGIGRLRPVSLLVMNWSGAASLTINVFSAYDSDTRSASTRNHVSPHSFDNFHILKGDDVELELLAKNKDTSFDNVESDSLLDLTFGLESVGTVKGLKISGDNIDLSDGSFMNRSLSFDYLVPFLTNTSTVVDEEDLNSVRTQLTELGVNG